MEIREIFSIVDEQVEKFTDFLCDICSFEAQATDKAVIDRLMDFIENFAVAQGFVVERTPMDACGDFLTIDMNPGSEKGCLFLGHTDTVHEPGLFGPNPVTCLEDRIIAPGVIDCKGGIAIALLAMKALKDSGYSKQIRLLLTSDEEVSNRLGGPAEMRFFEDKSKGFPYAINCETTESDEVVISRKGVYRCQMEIHGVSGHSGIHYFQCSNPIQEAAYKIVALQEKSQVGGVTYSCNIVEGGSAFNVIPDTCTLSVDVRVPRPEDMETAEETVKQIVNTSFVRGTESSVVFESRRPPMVKNAETLALFEKLLKVCKDYDLGSLTPVESGGGSDSCYTQAAGVPSICGMGGVGRFCHTNKEYIEVSSIPLRAKILTAFLQNEMK